MKKARYLQKSNRLKFYLTTEVRGHDEHGKERLLRQTRRLVCTLNARQTVVTVRRSAEQRLAIPDFHEEEGRRVSARGRGTDAGGAW